MGEAVVLECPLEFKRCSIEFSVGLTEVEFVGCLGVGVTYGVPCELGGQVAGGLF